MLVAIVVVLRAIVLACGGHRAVALENLALRQFNAQVSSDKVYLEGVSRMAIDVVSLISFVSLVSPV